MVLPGGVIIMSSRRIGKSEVSVVYPLEFLGPSWSLRGIRGHSVWMGLERLSMANTIVSVGGDNKAWW